VFNIGLPFLVFDLCKFSITALSTLMPLPQRLSPWQLPQMLPSVCKYVIILQSMFSIAPLSLCLSVGHAGELCPDGWSDGDEI